MSTGRRWPPNPGRGLASPGTTTTADGSGGGDGAGATTQAPPGTTAAPDPSAPLQGLALEVVATGLHQPTVVTAPPGDPRLFVVERRGVIRIVGDNGLRDQPFLDIQDRVGPTGSSKACSGSTSIPTSPTTADSSCTTSHLGKPPAGRVHGRRRPEPTRTPSGCCSMSQPADATDIRHYAGMVIFGPDGLL